MQLMDLRIGRSKKTKHIQLYKLSTIDEIKTGYSLYSIYAHIIHLLKK